MRTRTTNFKTSTSAIWSCYNRDFVQELVALGVPIGRKSHLISHPSHPIRSIDYWRGIIDGDGSLGKSAKGNPYISLTTASDRLAEDYTQFICENSKTKTHPLRNKRDDIYNIRVNGTNAVRIIQKLYYPGCLALERKMTKALEMI